MLLASCQEVKKLESHSPITLCFSFASFMLCNLPHATIPGLAQANHESVADDYTINVIIFLPGNPTPASQYMLEILNFV